LYGEFSEGEVDLFRQVVQPGQVVIEVGANIGAHTVFLAKQVGTSGVVVAFEPQRLVFQTLCANVSLNSLPNVVALQQAVGAEPGTVKVPELDWNRENNFGGLSLGEYEKGDDVPVVTLDSLKMRRCDFIKVDVEGMEEQALRGGEGLIRRLKPVLYVENDRLEKSDSLIRYIDSLGYRMYWHKPPYFNRNNFLGNSHDVFPRIVSLNMLCLRRDVPQELHGFDEVKVPAAETPES
jgi:FkbM family methyltransferase